VIGLPLTRRIGQLRRYRHILSVFVRHGFGSMVSMLPMERTWWQRWRRYPTSEPQSLPAHFREALEELGPTFVKLGQVLSTRPDVLPPEYVTELARLQDQVPPLPWDIMREVIAEELGAAPETVFRRIEQRPMAAASLAQVHGALLADGQQVVIKVQRPNIVPTIEVDLTILKDLAHYVQHHTPLGEYYDLEAIADDFAETLHQELDYLREGHNADRFRQTFAHEPGIYIPKVYWEYTTRRVLTLERISGIKIDNVAALKAAGFDMQRLATQAARMSVKEILEDGFFHADPHPGNLVVMENGAIGAMDFGMVGTLSDGDRVNLIRLYAMAAQLDAEGVVDQLIHIGAAPADVDRRQLGREIQTLLRRYTGIPLNDIKAAEVINEIRPIVFRYRLRLPSSYWLLAKVISIMESIGRRLAPDFDIFGFARPSARSLLLKDILPNRRHAEQLLRQGLVWEDLLDELPRAASRWLARIDAREPIPLGLDKGIVDRLDRMITRLALSLIIAGMTIGIAIIMPSASQGSATLQAVLWFGFAVAIGLGFWVMISIFRKR